MNELLRLNNIGKVYVSEGAINIGIRKIDLSFSMGEIVAITGKSGSGKSTLLNVISGIDSYEEGEMFIENNPTSHYTQEDWEMYREKYISFIFQDYNIIDSFTVLENVELSLISIEDKKTRRNRALELIEKVGLSDCINQKGSKLSGGQKQRTVIARALAKDSPIILADEPTGNLDSKTSEEIIELLKSVSKDKLLIIVTHNFEQVENIATRHIRIHDGSIEYDHSIKNSNIDSFPIKDKNTKPKTIKNSIRLGWSLFKSKPKLSVFMCILLFIGTLALTITTSSFGTNSNIFESNYMFNNIDGRVIITKNDGSVITENELLELKQITNAKSVLRYDYLLDTKTDYYIEIYSNKGEELNYLKECYFSNEKIKIDNGKLPEKDEEIALKVPISYKSINNLGVIGGHITLNERDYTITGITYYTDNNISPTIIFTDNGFNNYGAILYSFGQSTYEELTLKINSSKGYKTEIEIPQTEIDYNNGEKSIRITGKEIRDYKNSLLNLDNTITFDYSVKINHKSYYYDYYSFTSREIEYEKTYNGDEINIEEYENNLGAVISYGILKDLSLSNMENNYKQASIFYNNNKEAKEQLQVLKDNGYSSVLASSHTSEDSITTIMDTVTKLFNFVTWVVSIILISLILYLCFRKSMDTFKHDLTIMRSMGITVKIVKLSIYFRTMICIIPSLLCIIIYSILISNVPAFNLIFNYLYFWQYILIFVGIILISLLVSRKLLKRLFKDTIKKNLVGGSQND